MKNPFHDFPVYSENYLKIITKDNESVPLVLNTFQSKIEKAIRKQREDNRPVRIIVVKCRQSGGSTVGTAITYHECSTNFFTRGMIVAHNIKSTNNLFNMCKHYWDESPEKIRPMKRNSNSRELVFDNPKEGEDPGLKSSIVVGTAGAKTEGRSGTYTVLHISELAHWPNAGTILGGLLNTMPSSPNTIVIMESTSNGMGGDGKEFYRRVKEAELGKSDYELIFCPFWEADEYELHHFDPFVYDDDPRYHGEEELNTLLLKEGFDPEKIKRKLAWRRYKIKNDMGSDIMSPLDQFKQEYPSTIDESFIASGSPVFDVQKIKAEYQGLTSRNPTLHRGFTLSQITTDYLKVYARPEKGEIYAIGGDVSEGLAIGDSSSLYVVNSKNEQVASWHHKVDPDLLGDVMCEIGRLFNDAILAPEINNMGITTLLRIKEKEYPNIFERINKEGTSDKYTKKLGWRTTAQSKREMLTKFSAMYRDGIAKIKDPLLLEEMMTVVTDENGNANLNGKDRTVAACIAYQAIGQAPSTFQVEVIIPRTDE